jgi:hypothetical protein
MSTKTVYDGRIHGEVGLGLGLDVEILTAKLSLRFTVATANVDVGLRGETPCGGGGVACVRYCTEIGVSVPPVILPINSLSIGFVVGLNVTATASGSFHICYSFPGCPSSGLAVGFCGKVAGDVSVSYLLAKVGAHVDFISGCVALYGTPGMLDF